jgi:hypothetical protein
MVGVAVCLCAFVRPLFAVFLVGFGGFRFNLVLGSTPKVARLIHFFHFLYTGHTV